MGMSFANIHLHKHNNCNIQTLCEYLYKEMQAKQYTQTTDRDNADVTAVIYEAPDSKWVTLSISSWQEHAVNWQSVAEAYSDTFNTDALVTVCDDSDYLFMHIRNTANGIDGWVNVGKPEYGKMCRRTSLAPFRKIVLDFDAFKDAVQKKYVCAEDALYATADTLALTNHQCGMDAQHIEVLPQSGRTALYFTAPQTEITEPAFLRFSGSIPSLQSFGEEMRLNFYNMGGKSKGIAVAFDASDGDELTYENVILAVQNKPFAWGDMREFPVSLEHRILDTGEKVYYGECRDIVIPPFNMKKVKWLSLKFIPKGNSRKALDIKVTISPLGTEQKETWYFWKHHSSKREYAEDDFYCVNPDDYDLD